MHARPMTYAPPGQISSLIRETRARYASGTPPHRIAYWLTERLDRIRSPRQWCPVDSAGWMRLDYCDVLGIVMAILGMHASPFDSPDSVS
jgi:hypothetical protein